MIRFTLTNFVRESNRIEGILRDPTPDELSAHAGLLGKDKIEVIDLEFFVSAVQPGAKLRRSIGLNVYVGEHVPPPGGPQIQNDLDTILDAVNASCGAPYAYRYHQQYETLHPFTDGNGRSGRALWLWMMGGIENAPLGFLHHWYYQSLSNERSGK